MSAKAVSAKAVSVKAVRAKAVSVGAACVGKSYWPKMATPSLRAVDAGALGLERLVGARRTVGTELGAGLGSDGARSAWEGAAGGAPLCRPGESKQCSVLTTGNLKPAPPCGPTV